MWHFEQSRVLCFALSCGKLALWFASGTLVWAATVDSDARDDPSAQKHMEAAISVTNRVLYETVRRTGASLPLMSSVAPYMGCMAFVALQRPFGRGLMTVDTQPVECRL